MLPKIQLPLFTITIPSTGKPLQFRRFTVREEKILLMAEQGNTVDDILTAVNQIITNCCAEELDIDKVAVFDYDYIFLKLRSQSVSNIVPYRIRDTEDEKIYEFEIDLETIELKAPPKIELITIIDDIGVMLKYPTIAAGRKFAETGDPIGFIADCVDYIYDAANIYKSSDTTREELIEYISGFPKQSLDAIEAFFATIPILKYEYNYRNSLGQDRTFKIEGIQSFFLCS